MTKEKVFTIPFTHKMADDFNRLYEDACDRFPFIPNTLHLLARNISLMAGLGCVKHNILVSGFSNGKYLVYVCRKCNPKKYKKYKAEYRQVEVEFNLGDD